MGCFFGCNILPQLEKPLTRVTHPIAVFGKRRLGVGVDRQRGRCGRQQIGGFQQIARAPVLRKLAAVEDHVRVAGLRAHKANRISACEYLLFV
jgi:hypothetical protein